MDTISNNSLPTVDSQTSRGRGRPKGSAKPKNQFNPNAPQYVPDFTSMTSEQLEALAAAKREQEQNLAMQQKYSNPIEIGRIDLKVDSTKQHLEILEKRLAAQEESHRSIVQAQETVISGLESNNNELKEHLKVHKKTINNLTTAMVAMQELMNKLVVVGNLGIAMSENDPNLKRQARQSLMIQAHNPNAVFNAPTVINDVMLSAAKLTTEMSKFRK